MAEAIGLLQLQRTNSSGSVARVAAASQRTGVASLSAHLQRRIFLHLPLESVALAAGACTAFAVSCRQDSLWRDLLSQRWAENRSAGEVELEQRFNLALQQRRAALGETSPTRVPTADWSDALPAAASSSFPLPPLTPLLSAQRLSESGIPRARSSASLNSQQNAPPSSSSSQLSLPPNVRSALSPRPLDSYTPQPSPLGSDAEGTTPNFPSLPQMQQQEDEEDHKSDDGDNSSSQTTRSPHERWCAAPGSLKSVYQDEFKSAHRRFEQTENMEASNEMPGFIKFSVQTSAIVAFVSWIFLHSLSASTMGYSGEGPITVQVLLHPTLLSLVYTTSFLLLFIMLLYNLMRVLILSLVAKAALWKQIGSLDPRSGESVFRRADKIWWRTHPVNRWYLVRYQVWHPPVASVPLLFLTACGLFVLAWTLITMICSSAGWSIWIGLVVVLTLPGITSAVGFQLGRMLFLSRWTHVFLTAAISVSQICMIVWFISSGRNILLLTLLDRSLFLSFLHTCFSFLPNLLLLFGELWISDEYLVLGWTPVILPPRRMDVLDSRIGRAAASRTQAPAQAQDIESGPDVHSPRALTTTNGGGSRSTLPWSLIPESGSPETMPFALQSGDPATAANAPANPTDHLLSFIPEAHWMGRAIFGAWAEEHYFLPHPRAMSVVASRIGLCVGAGFLLYLSGHTYWSQLFSIYIGSAVADGVFQPGQASFSGLSFGMKVFHILSLLQLLVIGVILILLITLTTLQNRNWQWWWLGFTSSLSALGFIGVHYGIWHAEVERALIHASRALSGGAGDSASSASLSAAFSLRQLFAEHWLYSWSTWFLGVSALTGVSLLVCTIALAFLYRPKNVDRSADGNNGVGANLYADEFSRGIGRSARDAELPALLESDEVGEYTPRRSNSSLLYDADDVSRSSSFASLPTSESHTDVRAPLVGSHPLPVRSSPAITTGSKASMSFFEALQQPSPTSPLVDEESFHRQLRQIQAHAAAVQATRPRSDSNSSRPRSDSTEM